MKIPNYIPIGFCKGYSKDKSEWVYGWHWTKVPYECMAVNESIRHYIRVQNNLDWGLTTQEDYEVEPDSIGIYIGKKDKESNPIFLGNKVEIMVRDRLMNNNIKLVGIVCYEVNQCQYVIKTDNNFIYMNDIIEMKVIGDKYKPKTVHTVSLHFKTEDIHYKDILNGIKDYYNFFGVYPKEIELTDQQYKSVINDKEFINLIQSLSINVKIKDKD